MNKIRASIDSILSQYPWIEKDELVKLYLDFIDRNYIDIFKKAVDRTAIPSNALQKREIFRERRKPLVSRRSPDELKKWKSFMDWLEHIKLGGEGNEVLDQDISSIKWQRSSSDRTLNFSQQEQEAFEKGIEASVHSTSLVRNMPVMGDLEIEKQKNREENNLNALRSFVVSEEKNEINAFENISDAEMNLISSLAREIAGDKFSGLKKYYNDDYGYIIEITLEQNDKDAFKTWFKIIDRVEPLNMDAKVMVNWTQGNILNDSDLTQKMIDAMLRLDIAPKRNDRFKASKEAYEGGF